MSRCLAILPASVSAKDGIVILLRAFPGFLGGRIVTARAWCAPHVPGQDRGSVGVASASTKMAFATRLKEVKALVGGHKGSVVRGDASYPTAPVHP